jgi:uncharacterized membrane protein
VLIISDMHPVVVFLAAIVVSLLVFSAERLLLGLLYGRTLVKWSFFRESVEKTRRRGAPLITKYGLLGLVLFVAIPIPGTGIYAGALLSWLMGLKWPASLLAIIPGTAISNGIITLSILGIMHGTNISG